MRNYSEIIKQHLTDGTSSQVLALSCAIGARFFLATYGMAALHAILVWMICAPIGGFLVYRISYRLFLKLET